MTDLIRRRRLRLDWPDGQSWHYHGLRATFALANRMFARRAGTRRPHHPPTPSTGSFSTCVMRSRSAPLATGHPMVLVWGAAQLPGKARLNTMKALVICDPVGRLLFCGETRPGSMHDLTQARTAGLVDLLLHAPLQVQVLADAGYQGLGTETRGAVMTPRPKPRKRQTTLPASVIAAHDAARKRHSSQRIRVEHVIGHLKNWRILGRHHGRRENFDATIRAIAGLLSDHQHNDRTEHTARPLKALPARPHSR
ncbi:transposase family protein [Micromonospora sp. NPDC048170]|uniref:transposase family protein n=1 Tax=Micromonospora sp. NPDC048170 TaxID=3154819 RepID=UPI003405FC81